MRGSVTWFEAMEMSNLERKKCDRFISKRFEDMKNKKVMYPVY